MLRAGLQVLQPGGRLCFVAIEMDPTLTGPKADDVFAAAPPHPVADPSYAALLERAGFVDIAVEDVTADYRKTSSAWLTDLMADEAEMSRLFGSDVFFEKIAGHRGSIEAIDDGYLRRSLVMARKPRTGSVRQSSTKTSTSPNI